jgi:tRNA A37 threonylcarbamoyladenosine biosynthesis protein TsaE
LSDYIDGCTVLAVEWAEKAGSALPADRLDIHVRHCRLQAREIVFVARGLRACRLLDRVRSRQDLVGASPRRRRG